MADREQKKEQAQADAPQTEAGKPEGDSEGKGYEQEPAKPNAPATPPSTDEDAGRAARPACRGFWAWLKSAFSA